MTSTKKSRSWLGVSRIAYLVDGIDYRIERRIVTYRRVGAAEVVVDRTGQSDDRYIVLLGEDARTGQRSVAADDNQRIDACRTHVVIGRLAPLGRGELLAARRFQDRAALLYDIAHAARGKVLDLVIYQAVVSALDTLDAEFVVYSRSRHGTYRRIHAGGIAARGQNTDCLDCCHILQLLSYNYFLSVSIILPLISYSGSSGTRYHNIE